MVVLMRQLMATPNNRFSSDRGQRLRSAKEGVDDLDKSASLVVGEAPRRSAVSLGDS